jgi:predicted nucleotidyltransferase
MVRSADEVSRVAIEAVAVLERELLVSAAFLFGSHVEGAPHAESDIDLAVFTPEESRLCVDEKARLQLRLQRVCAIDLELHLYPARALKRARPTNFYGYLLAHGKRIR